MSEQTQRGEVILLTGPPLAGKTSTAMAWAAQRERVTAPLDWDEVHSLLFRGDRLRAVTGVDARYRFAARVATATAAEVIDLGHDCVITGARVPASPTDPPEWLGHWDDLDELDPITIVLLPSLETRLERRLRDPGRLPGGAHPYSEDAVRESHQFGWEKWDDQPRAAIIDTSEMTPQEVVDAVEQATMKLSDRRL